MTAKYIFLAVAAVTAIGAAPASAPQEVGNPAATVERTATGSHIIGDPDAPHTLIEYMSYTCPHCADFERDGGDAIKLAYVGMGKYRFEIRHYLFSVPDLAVATAVHCVPTEKFFIAHSAVLKRQDEWLPKVRGATAAQKARWEGGTMPQRLRAAAGDIGLYDRMENLGLSRVQLDKCFADPAVYQPIVDQYVAASNGGINSTPTFLIDGMRLPGNTWPYVNAAMDQVLTAGN